MIFDKQEFSYCVFIVESLAELFEIKFSPKIFQVDWVSLWEAVQAKILPIIFWIVKIITDIITKLLICRLLKVLAMVWAGSQVTKLFRALGWVFCSKFSRSFVYLILYDSTNYYTTFRCLLLCWKKKSDLFFIQGSSTCTFGGPGIIMVHS